MAVNVCIIVDVYAWQGVVGGILEQVEVEVVVVLDVRVVTAVVEVPEVEIVVVEVMLAVVGGTVPSDGDASQVCTRRP